MGMARINLALQVVPACKVLHEIPSLEGCPEGGVGFGTGRPQVSAKRRDPQVLQVTGSRPGL